jgi:hypothetical protein
MPRKLSVVGTVVVLVLVLVPSDDPHEVAENTTPKHMQRQRVNDKIFFNIWDSLRKKSAQF